MKTQNPIEISRVEWGVLVLVVVGALNWGLVGLGGLIGSNLNLVNAILGGVPTAENVVYLLVGLAGLYMVYFGYQLFGARTGEDLEIEEQKATPR